MFPHVPGALMLLRVQILPWFADLPLDRIAPASVRRVAHAAAGPIQNLAADGDLRGGIDRRGARGFEVGDGDDIDHGVVGRGSSVYSHRSDRQGTIRRGCARSYPIRCWDAGGNRADPDSDLRA